MEILHPLVKIQNMMKKKNKIFKTTHQMIRRVIDSKIKMDTYFSKTSKVDILIHVLNTTKNHQTTSQIRKMSMASQPVQIVVPTFRLKSTAL